MKEKYIYREAKEEDISQLIKIENEFFNSSIAFTEDFLKKWYNHNKKMFYVVTNDKEEILGFTILVPITDKLYNKLKTGQSKDMADFKEEEVLQTIQSEYYYVADIASSNKALRASLILFKGITEFLGSNAHWVLTTPITKEGFAVCKSFGFKPLEDEFEIGQNLELEVTDSLRKRFIKTK